MNYTSKQIDKMSIEEIEELAYTLNEQELNEWTSNGYDGENYVKIANVQGARETYEAIKPLYDPKLDPDKKLFERILKFYNSLA